MLVLLSFIKNETMKQKENYDIIIIGGSYAGLQAAMTLGRALRKVLVIDSGRPCNRQTPHSHNFITQDGETPAAIGAKGREQLMNYPTVALLNDKATEVEKIEGVFNVSTELGSKLTARRILLTTGVKDIMPDIPGFADCWGISILHCPYCHGYEVRQQPTGVIGNGDVGFEFARIISNWTSHLTLYTNGISAFTTEQRQKLKSRSIRIIESELQEVVHDQGYIKGLIFKDGIEQKPSALYARLPFEQHTNLPVTLGCQLNEHGLIKTDGFGKTTVPGVYAAGDNCVLMRSVAVAVSAGLMAGAFVNKELIEEDF
jgi:thioredoxin reductase